MSQTIAVFRVRKSSTEHELTRYFILKYRPRLLDKMEHFQKFALAYSPSEPQPTVNLEGTPIRPCFSGHVEFRGMRISNRSDATWIVSWGDRGASVSGGGRSVYPADYFSRPRFVMERYGRTLGPGQNMTIRFSYGGGFVELIDRQQHTKKHYKRDGDVTITKSYVL